MDFNSKLAELSYEEDKLDREKICSLPIFQGQFKASIVEPLAPKKTPAFPSFSAFTGDGKNFDLVILGGGSGAFAAAIKASEMGAKVGIVEEGVTGNNPFPGIVTRAGKIDFKKLIEKKSELIQWAQKAKYWDILEHHKNITFINAPILAMW